MLNNLFFHSNGTYYAAYVIYGEDSIKCKIIMSDDGGKTAREVEIPYLNDQDFWIENMAVMENKVPIETNYILNNMIIEQSLPFFLGKADAKQTASNVKTKVNTYLSE